MNYFEEFKNGNTAIKYEQSEKNLEKLREVLKTAKPKDKDVPSGDCNYYYTEVDSELWLSEDDLVDTGLEDVYSLDEVYNSMKEQEKFKVGDWVVVLSNEDGGKHVIGKAYKITSTGNKPEYGLQGKDKSWRDTTWYYGSRDIRKATQEEIDSVNPKEKLYTIWDLSNGIVALINEDHPDVEKVIRLAFPKDKEVLEKGFVKYLSYKYLQKRKDNLTDYTIRKGTDLPTQSVEDFISQLNTNKNEQRSNNLQRVTSEITKPDRRGSVILRNRRQQITTGTRPKGNIQIPNIGKARINSVKISKNIVESSHY